jgi:hypothetical protein
MIAPIREPNHWSDGPSEALRRARRIVAEALLPTRNDQVAATRRVPAWQAWLFAAWVTGTASWYLMNLLGR